MRVKIKHRTDLFLFGFCFGVVFIIMIFSLDRTPMSRNFLIVTSVMTFIFLMMEFVQGFFYTTITIEKGNMKIDFLFGERHVPISCITRLDLRHKKNGLWGSNDILGGRFYRIYLNIDVTMDGKTRRICLNENTSVWVESSMLGQSRYYPKPDDETGLFNIYQCLCDLTGAKSSDDILNDDL